MPAGTLRRGGFVSLCRPLQAHLPQANMAERPDDPPRTLSVVLLTGCPFSSRSFSPLESSRSWILPAMADGSRLRTQMTLSRLLTEQNSAICQQREIHSQPLWPSGTHDRAL